MKPQLDVVGIGPQKTASSWLHACLAQHPGMCLPHAVKETFFFDRRFEKGWPWYWSHFRLTGPPRLTCEIGPTYFDSAAARARIAAHNPDCRVLVTLRHPVERAFSLYLHHKKKDGLTASFEEAIRDIPGILSGSRYAEHLPAWIEAFGRERVLIILQEDILTPERVLPTVYEFLGLAPAPLPDVAHERINVRSLPARPRLARSASQVARWLRARRLHTLVEWVKPWGRSFVYDGHEGEMPSLQEATARELEQMFAPDVRYVEQLSGRDLAHWRS